MHYKPCHQVTANLQLIIIIFIIIIVVFIVVVVVVVVQHGCLCHRHFFLVLFLNQRLSRMLRLQASHCSTFRIMCDVPSIAVFVTNLSNVFLVDFPNLSLSFSLVFQSLQFLRVQSYISGPTFVASL